VSSRGLAHQPLRGGCTQVPPNGLVLYTGTILTDEGKEKKVNIDFEPFKTINTSLYLCDNKFHTEALSELLESENKYGFIVMDGNGSLFGTLSGNTREILHKFSVDLPKKHGRGGQSALRFARLRMEKRHNYVRKVRAREPRFAWRVSAARGRLFDASLRAAALPRLQVAEMAVQFYITNDKVCARACRPPRPHHTIPYQAGETDCARAL
jgi:hypothetical protein